MAFRGSKNRSEDTHHQNVTCSGGCPSLKSNGPLGDTQRTAEVRPAQEARSRVCCLEPHLDKWKRLVVTHGVPLSERRLALLDPGLLPRELIAEGRRGVARRRVGFEATRHRRISGSTQVLCLRPAPRVCVLARRDATRRASHLNRHRILRGDRDRES